MKKKISLIVPCYNEQESIRILYEALLELSNKMHSNQFEFIFVDDGSKDDTLSIIKEFKKIDKRVRFISFSRNFGKEAAMYAGLEASIGDYVAIMDADMQDPPSLIEKMYRYIEEGYDQVATRRTTRKGEPPIRSFFARRFYKMINRLSKTEMVDGARDFRLMKRKVVDAILSMEEYNRYSKGIFSFVGFKTKWIEFENVERVAGQTKWSFSKLFVYAIEGIVSFSTKPLVMSAILGVLFCLISFIMILAIIIKTLIWSDPVGGWPSLVCIIFMVSGIQLFCTGIIGIYLSKAYLETKKRPIYIVNETEKDM